MKHLVHYVCLFSLSASLLAACGGQNPDGAAAGAESVGKVSSALSLPPGLSHDVKKVHFKAVTAPGNCNDTAVAETTADISTLALLPSLDPAGVGGVHAFADGLMTLPPGDYLICATPLDENGRPSEACGLASAPTTVVAEQTAEILLASQCDGDPNGLSDNVLIFNEQPVIDDVQIGPSKFIDQCGEAVITVTASDPNNETLSYSWEVLSGPGSSSLVGTGNQATFTPTAAGDYQLKVTVSDPQGGVVTQTFPIHVAEESNCEVTAACPQGTVEAEGHCWLRAQYKADESQETGSETCARVGLTGSDDSVTGLVWTQATFANVASKLGCTQGPDAGALSPSLFIDTASNSCFVTGYSTAQNAYYINPIFDYLTGQVGVQACQKPSGH
jgi:hypothetical protein